MRSFDWAPMPRPVATFCSEDGARNHPWRCRENSLDYPRLLVISLTKATSSQVFPCEVPPPSTIIRRTLCGPRPLAKTIRPPQSPSAPPLLPQLIVLRTHHG